jgi:hypothetical protein
LVFKGSSLAHGNVTSVQRGFTLDQHDAALLIRNGIVPYPFGDDEHFTFSKIHYAIPQLNTKVAFKHKKQLVLMFVAMPSQRAVDFGDPDISIVYLTDDAWRP